MNYLLFFEEISLRTLDHYNIDQLNFPFEYNNFFSFLQNSTTMYQRN